MDWQATSEAIERIKWYRQKAQELRREAAEFETLATDLEAHIRRPFYERFERAMREPIA